MTTNWYWGDIHNHCAASYGFGTVRRALDNARQHLDFCSITGHAFWPDMPMDLETQNRVIGMHLGGFAKLQHFWPQMLADLRKSQKAGQFVTLPSYEWHSMEYGDHNAYFPVDKVDLVSGPHLAGLIKNLKKTKNPFMLLPHHCGYVRGYRGLNWAHFNDQVSPLVEIYSNHGCGEADDAPYAYHHTMGPRVGESMLRGGLAAGHRFGFYASTDSHDGYPGHYGHGCFAVEASKLTRAAVWKAMQQKKTIASTGARITAQVHLADVGIGEVATYQPQMPLHLEIEAADAIAQVELIHGGQGHWRVQRLAGPDLNSRFVPGRYKVKIEMGWGRANAAVDWKVQATVKRGKLLGAQPCFRFSEYDMKESESCDRILDCSEKKITWQCRSKANPAGLLGGTHFHAGGTQAMILELDANNQTTLSIKTEDKSFEVRLADLTSGSVGDLVGGFCSPAIKIHRASAESEWSFKQELSFLPDVEQGFAYVRIIQSDGQVAWVSPIWFE